MAKQHLVQGPDGEIPVESITSLEALGLIARGNTREVLKSRQTVTELEEHVRSLTAPLEGKESSSEALSPGDKLLLESVELELKDVRVKLAKGQTRSGWLLNQRAALKRIELEKKVTHLQEELKPTTGKLNELRTQIEDRLVQLDELATEGLKNANASQARMIAAKLKAWKTFTAGCLMSAGRLPVLPLEIDGYMIDE